MSVRMGSHISGSLYLHRERAIYHPYSVVFHHHGLSGKACSTLCLWAHWWNDGLWHVCETKRTSLITRRNEVVGIFGNYIWQQTMIADQLTCVMFAVKHSFRIGHHVVKKWHTLQYVMPADWPPATDIIYYSLGAYLLVTLGRPQFN